MQGNTVVINRNPDLTYYVGDSKMELLFALLNEIGHIERGYKYVPEDQPSAVVEPVIIEGRK